jgi:hypothetical protein
MADIDPSSLGRNVRHFVFHLRATRAASGACEQRMPKAVIRGDESPGW